MVVRSFSAAVVLLAGAYIGPPISAAAIPGGLIAATQALASRVTTPASASTTPPVEIIDREAWGATAGRGESIDQVDEVVVHHFWRPSINEVVPADVETELVRDVEDLHVRTGWSGIGYNFVVFQSGRIYEGRGWSRAGAHTQGKNADSVGIAFAVDGDRHELTPEAWEAARRLIARGVAEGHLAPGARVTGHTDYAEKSCPGEKIHPHIQRLAPRRGGERG